MFCSPFYQRHIRLQEILQTLESTDSQYINSDKQHSSVPKFSWLATKSEPELNAHQLKRGSLASVVRSLLTSPGWFAFGAGS